MDKADTIIELMNKYNISKEAARALLKSDYFRKKLEQRKVVVCWVYRHQ